MQENEEATTDKIQGNYGQIFYSDKFGNHRFTRRFRKHAQLNALKGSDTEFIDFDEEPTLRCPTR